MKKLNFNNEKFEAEKIIKTSTDIFGISNNTEIFRFKGISDFSKFTLENGDYDIEENLVEKNRADIDYIAVMMGVDLSV